MIVTKYYKNCNESFINGREKPAYDFDEKFKLRVANQYIIGTLLTKYIKKLSILF